MSNRFQLVLQVIGLSLALLTMVLSFTNPVYDKLNTMSIRLTELEVTIKYTLQRLQETQHGRQKESYDTDGYRSPSTSPRR